MFYKKNKSGFKLTSFLWPTNILTNNKKKQNTTLRENSCEENGILKEVENVTSIEELDMYQRTLLAASSKKF